MSSMHAIYKVLPGDIIAASRFGYWHVGIVSEVTFGGAPTVISASKQTGRVVEETWATFAGGGAVRRVGYPGTLPRHAVVAQARAQIGQPWTWSNNCEHVATRAHGIEPQSGQLRAAILAGITLLCICADSPRSRTG